MKAFYWHISTQIELILIFSIRIHKTTHSFIFDSATNHEHPLILTMNVKQPHTENCSNVLNGECWIENPNICNESFGMNVKTDVGGLDAACIHIFALKTMTLIVSHSKYNRCIFYMQLWSRPHSTTHKHSVYCVLCFC